MTCPICGVARPEEMHHEWCTYDGPEPEETDTIVSAWVAR